MVEDQNMIAPNLNPRPNNAINLERDNNLNIMDVDPKLSESGKNLNIMFQNKINEYTNLII